MAVDRATFQVRGRSQTRDNYLRRYAVEIPTADVGPGTEPFVLASVVADVVAPLYADANYSAKATDLLTAVDTALNDHGRAIGRARKGATGSQGFVIADVVSGGSLINEGTEIRYAPRGTRLAVTVTDTYNPGDLIPVESIDVGAAVNIAAGAKLTWSSPPPGVLSTALVFENSDGSGISGGAPAEDDDTYRAVLLDRRANPPAAGNAAQYCATVEDLPGIGVQKAFCIPCWNGPGTTAICFTMRPSEPGASRLPNGAQLAEVESALKDAFPPDDGISVVNLLEDLVRISLEVTWKSAANGWVDQTPWPLFYADPVHCTGTPTNTTATLTSTSVIAAPVVGQTLGFFDESTGKFKRKRISAVSVVSATHTYTLTFDTTTANASDSFVPVSGQVVSPWSPSLSSVVAPILSYVDKQGPGEMFASFGDVGLRQRRFPPPAPDAYPSKIENRILDAIFTIVADAEVVEPATPFVTTLGTVGASLYVHAVSDIGVYPQ